MAKFTAANARENAAKAHAARRHRLATGKPAAETFPQTPQMNTPQAADAYVNARLSRVRLQLARIDDMLDSERDPQKIDRLASASARLAEQERQLANRPLPGTRKPAPERAQRSQPGAWLVESTPSAAPAPTQPETPPPVEPLPG